MAHSRAINQRTTDIYFVEAQGWARMWGRVHNLFILKEHLGLNEEHSDRKLWDKNKHCRLRETSGPPCGGPFSFPSVLSDWSFLGSVFLPQFCLHSGVWQACCVCMRSLVKCRHHLIGSHQKAMVSLPVEAKISSFILLIRHGHSVTLLAGIVHLNPSVFLCTIFPWDQGII